jgi:hypothetical protein
VGVKDMLKIKLWGQGHSKNKTVVKDMLKIKLWVKDVLKIKMWGQGHVKNKTVWSRTYLKK